MIIWNSSFFPALYSSCSELNHKKIQYCSSSGLSRLCSSFLDLSNFLISGKSSNEKKPETRNSWNEEFPETRKILKRGISWNEENPQMRMTWSAKKASPLLNVNTLVGNDRTDPIFIYQTWIFCKKNGSNRSFLPEIGAQNFATYQWGVATAYSIDVTISNWVGQPTRYNCNIISEMNTNIINN